MARDRKHAGSGGKADLGLLLWLYGGKQKQEIAEELDVQPGTVTAWAKKYDWDRRRQEFLLAPDNLKALLYKEAARVIAGEATAVDVKTLGQLMQMIKILENEINIYVAVPIMRRFNEFCVREGAEKEWLKTLFSFQKAFNLNLIGPEK
jgi:hypothetical protein